MARIYRNGQLIANYNVFKLDVTVDNIHIRYSNNYDGADMTDAYDDQTYIGIYVGETASETASDYIWKLILKSEG